MSLAAAVYLPDVASRQWAFSRVAGRSVLLRLLLTAIRAGVREIGLPRILADETLLAEIRRHPSLAATVSTLEDQAFGPAPVLLLPAHSVVDAGSLRKLREAGEKGIVAALEESKGSQAPLLVITGEQTRALANWLVAGAPLGEELENQVRSGRLALVAGGGYSIAVTDAPSRREAEAALYRNLGTDTDSLVDRLVNRPCSRLLTRLLVRLPVTPNAVSLIGLAFGLAAAWQFWLATPGSALLGFFLFMVEVVADHTDGEVARLTFQESVLGQWLDVSIDTLTHSLLVLGIAATASRAGGPLMLLVGALAVFGIVASALFVNFFPLPADRSQPLGRALLTLGNRDPFYLVLLGFAFLLWKAEWALPYLLALLALGSQAYWVTYLLQRRAAGR